MAIWGSHMCAIFFSRIFWLFFLIYSGWWFGAGAQVRFTVRLTFLLLFPLSVDVVSHSLSPSHPTPASCNHNHNHHKENIVNRPSKKA